MYICKIFTFLLGINLFIFNNHIFCDVMLRKFDNPFLYREVTEKEQESKLAVAESQKTVESQMQKEQEKIVKNEDKLKSSGVRSCNASGCVDFD